MRTTALPSLSSVRDPNQRVSSTKEILSHLFVNLVLAGIRMNLRGAFFKGRKTYEWTLVNILQIDAMGWGEDHNKNKQQVIIRRENQQDLVISGLI